MISQLVLDTNVFFHYANENYEGHLQAVILIDTKTSYASKLVETEINIILHERRKLDKEIKKHMGHNTDLKNFTPSIPFKDRELKLLEELRGMDPNSAKNRLKYIMFIEASGLITGFKKVKHIDIQPSDLLQVELQKIISNGNDVRILSDSVYWCHRNNDRCIFHTQDKEDFLNKKGAIEKATHDFFNVIDLLKIQELLQT